MGKSGSQEQKKKLEIVFLSTACRYNYQLQLGMHVLIQKIWYMKELVDDQKYVYVTAYVYNQISCIIWLHNTIILNIAQVIHLTINNNNQKLLLCSRDIY